MTLEQFRDTLTFVLAEPPVTALALAMRLRSRAKSIGRFGYIDPVVLESATFG